MARFQLPGFAVVCGGDAACCQRRCCRQEITEDEVRVTDSKIRIPAGKNEARQGTVFRSPWLPATELSQCRVAKPAPGAAKGRRRQGSASKPAAEKQAGKGRTKIARTCKGGRSRGARGHRR